ncbi:sulfite oxidase [Microtetraspora sp. NBRC 16547]|uniref:sulfite oxidase n=1 Tax=Microtetraspora sp. NBRC 16547 TaxID=3030993 RepID=UPI0024A3D45D|nr:sulfite oxidase [Microtetraspora sp. NBRC 16547]GLX01275.1 oxidoreductase [Microtetraspora sp. NBRC 16547]
MSANATGSRLPAWAAGLAGVTAGAVALGVAELVAGLTTASASPVIAVGGAMVDRTPAVVKEWAIRTFGESDKAVLVTGIVIVVALIAAGLGLLARRRVGYGTAGLVAFGVVGVIAAVSRPDSGPLDFLPSTVGAAAGAWALALLFRRAERHEEPSVATEPDTRTGRDGAPHHDRPVALREPAGSREPADSRKRAEPPVRRAGAALYTFDRRKLLTGVAVGVGVAGAGTVAGRLLGGREDVTAARRSVALALPRPAVAAKPLPAGADLHISGLSPFVTPNHEFYRVDTALVVPGVDPRSWTLKIHGMVDRPVELTFADLLRRPLVEADVTLTCVSNDVGGPYVGNARWLGARLADVLREAGIRRGADMLLSVSQDGWTSGTPVDVVMDGREALLAVAMNGEVLPAAHGFPVRQVVPGLYGYVSATKWVTEIKVTRFDQDTAYWTPRGWAARAPIKTESRIDVPRDGDRVPAGRTTIAGVAWAQHRGVDAVEVQVDGGAWRRATLADVPGPDTWRQWSIDWDLEPGGHTISVRATDATGYTQTPKVAPPAPDGATGYHSIRVRVG